MGARGDHWRLTQESDVLEDQAQDLPGAEPAYRLRAPWRRAAVGVAVAAVATVSAVVAAAALRPGPTTGGAGADPAALLQAHALPTAAAGQRGRQKQDPAARAEPAAEPATEAQAEEPAEKSLKRKMEVCKMAVKGDDCYNSVVWAMTHGIKEHPEWYDGLTKKSLFEDFQAIAARKPKSTKCHHKPCKTAADCQAAKPGSPCYAGVRWDMTEGIKKHPEWYPGLTEDSSFVEFQEHTHESNKTLCPAPCNAQPFQIQTLFCWMAVQAEGYELGLTTAQLEKKVGIFACDDYALISTKNLGLDGVDTLIISNMMVEGSTMDAGTSPNAPVFVEAWNKINEDGRFRDHDWIAKSDPDAVFLPDRLLERLQPGQQPENPYPPPYQSDPSRGQFLLNCDLMAGWGAGWGNGWPMMYGSLEVVSRDALDTYYANKDSCPGPGGLGEDAYMGLCLRALQVGELFMRHGDNACMGGSCDDHSFVSYHPYKETGMWMDCYERATR